MQIQTKCLYVLYIILVILVSIGLVYSSGLIGVLALSCLVLGALTSCLTPLIPFALYFAVLFFHEAMIPGTTTSINTLLAPAFFGVCGIWWITGKTNSIRSPILFLLAAVASYFLFSAITGYDAEAGFTHAKYVVIYFLWAVCIALMLTRESTIMKFTAIIFLLGVASGTVGIIEGVGKNLLSTFSGHWGNNVRVQGFAPNPVVYAWQLVYTIPFGFFLFAQTQQKWLKASVLIGYFILIIAASLTFNRQTYIFIFLLTLLCGFVFDYKNKKLVLGFLGSFGIIISIPILPLILKRMITVTNLSRDYSFLERRDSFLLGMEMFKKEPYTGIGLGSFHTKWREFLPPEYDTFFAQYRMSAQPKFPDFTYLQLLSETGLIGLFVFIAFHAFLIRTALSFRKKAAALNDKLAVNYSTMVLCLLSFIVLSSFIQDIFLTPRSWLVYGLALLLLPRIFGLEKTEENL